MDLFADIIRLFEVLRAEGLISDPPDADCMPEEISEHSWNILRKLTI